MAASGRVRCRSVRGWSHSLREDKNIFIHVELFLEEVLTYLPTSELQPVCQVPAHPHSVFSFLVHEVLGPSWVDGQGPLGGFLLQGRVLCCSPFAGPESPRCPQSRCRHGKHTSFPCCQPPRLPGNGECSALESTADLGKGFC